MDENRWALRVTEWKPNWSKNVSRAAGRPKRRWGDDIASFLIENNEPGDFLIAARRWIELEDGYAKLTCAKARP